MWGNENKGLKKCSEASLVQTKQTIITDPETLKAFDEANYLAKNGGKKYKSFDEVMKDVFRSV